jgi:hypothetical protein
LFNVYRFFFIYNTTLIIVTKFFLSHCTSIEAHQTILQIYEVFLISAILLAEERTNQTGPLCTQTFPFPQPVLSQTAPPRLTAAPAAPASSLQHSFLRRQVCHLKKERTENQGEERRPGAYLRRRKQNKNHCLLRFLDFAGDVTSHRRCRKGEEKKTSL